MADWSMTYAAWAEFYDLPVTHERVARAVVSQKLAEAVERRQFNKQAGCPRIDEG